MDFMSWLLTLIGMGSDQAMRQSDKRAEVPRLNAEVAGEVGKRVISSQCCTAPQTACVTDRKRTP